MTFSNTPLPRSPHTSEDAHGTVAHRRRARSVLVAAAVLLVVGISVTVFALRWHQPAGIVEPGPSSTSSPSVTASPSATTDPNTTSTDLTLAPGVGWMNGSVGSFPGTVWIAIRNNGPAPVDQVDLTFTLPVGGYTTNGSAWNGCATDTAHGTVSCSVAAPVVGGTRSYSFGIYYDNIQAQRSQTVTFPTVSATPHGHTDPNPADNTGTIFFSSQGGASINVTAGRVTATGGRGTVALTLSADKGFSVPAAFRLNFHYSAAVQPDPGGFPGCDRNATDQTITCMVLSPASWSMTRDYSFPFIVDAAQPNPQLSVAYAPDFWPAGQYVKTVPIDVCSNC